MVRTPGRMYWLVQGPYIAGTDDNPLFEAIVADRHGNGYTVTWRSLLTYEGVECDWDDFVLHPLVDRILSRDETEAALRRRQKTEQRSHIDHR